MKKQKFISAAIITVALAALTIGTLSFPKKTESLPPPETVFEPIPLPVIEKVEAPAAPILLEVKQATPTLPPTLKRICSCESTGKPYNEPRQFNADGSVVKGKVNPLDTGMCQINLKYHEAAAARLDYDLFTEYGNASYAIHLYETQGTTPWNWSASCWSQ